MAARTFFAVICEKELERIIKNKSDEFWRKKKLKIQSGCEAMRAVAASKMKISGSEK